MVVSPESIWPPLIATHEKVTPLLVDDPFNVNVGVRQVNTRSGPAFAFGFGGSVTQTVSDEVQVTIVGLVTVNI